MTGNGRSISVSTRSLGGRSVASARTPDRTWPIAVATVGDIDGASRLGPAGHRHLGAERVPHLRLLPGRFAQLRGRPGSGPQGHGVHAGTAQDHAGEPGVHAPGRALRRRPRASPSSSTSAPASRPSATSTRSPRRPTPSARVVYVDHDPVAVAHSQAVLAGNDGRGRRRRRPAQAPGDPGQPRGRRDCSTWTGRWRCCWSPCCTSSRTRTTRTRRSPSCATRSRPAACSSSRTPRTRASRSPTEQAEGAVDVYQNIRNPLIMRSREEIARFFEGYDMVEPGLVPMPRLAARHARRGRGSRTPSRASPAWGARRERPPTPDPRARTAEDRLRRFATIWSRAIFPVDRHLADPRRVRGAPAAAGPAAERGPAAPGPSTRPPASAVGAALVAAHCTDPEALSPHPRRRRRLPGAVLRPAGPAPPRRAGPAAPGSSTRSPPASPQALRERTLAEQEAISRAALTARSARRARRCTPARPASARSSRARPSASASPTSTATSWRSTTRCTRMFGGSEQTMRGRKVSDWTHPEDAPQVWRLYERAGARRTRALPRREAVLPPRRHRAVDQPDGLAAARRRRRTRSTSSALMEDTTERRLLNLRLRYEATHDALTGLPNRTLFFERLEKALAAGDGPALRPVLPRPRRLQDHQRQPRPRGRRPAAGRGRRPAAVAARPRPARWSPGSAATSSWP